MGCPDSAWAVDTLETFDPGGVTDFELYAGYRGAGKRAANRRVLSEALVGLGVTRSFSGYVSTSGLFSEHLSGGDVTHGFGVFGTPLDTHHFDLDLTLDFGLTGGEDLTVTPGFELNIDGEPDLASYGLFLVGGAEWGGRDAADDDSAQARHTLEIGTALGAYVTPGEAHQLLLRYDLTMVPKPETGRRKLRVGGVSLGYNVMVHDAVELIHEVSLEPPHRDERCGVGVVAGFIVALDYSLSGSRWSGCSARRLPVSPYETTGRPHCRQSCWNDRTVPAPGPEIPP